MESEERYMMKAMRMVEDLEMPAWQWMRTADFRCNASSMNLKASRKYCARF